MRKQMLFDDFVATYTLLPSPNGVTILSPLGNEIDGISPEHLDIVEAREETHPGTVWSVIRSTNEEIEEENEITDDEEYLSETDEDDESSEIEEDEDEDSEDEDDTESPEEYYVIVPGIEEINVYCYFITEEPAGDDLDDTVVMMDY